MSDTLTVAKTAHTGAHNALVISRFMRHKDKETSVVNEVTNLQTLFAANCVEPGSAAQTDSKHRSKNVVKLWQKC